MALTLESRGSRPGARTSGSEGLRCPEPATPGRSGGRSSATPSPLGGGEDERPFGEPAHVPPVRLGRGDDDLGRPPAGGNDIDASVPLAFGPADEGDASAVRGPPWHPRAERRAGEREALRAIAPPLPQLLPRVGDPGQPLPHPARGRRSRRRPHPGTGRSGACPRRSDEARRGRLGRTPGAPGRPAARSRDGSSMVRW